MDEARTLLCATQSDRLHALCVLAVYLGLRRGELLGLRWANIDLDQEFLLITHTLQRVGPPHVVQQIVGHSAIDVTTTIKEPQARHGA